MAPQKQGINPLFVLNRSEVRLKDYNTSHLETTDTRLIVYITEPPVGYTKVVLELSPCGNIVATL